MKNSQNSPSGETLERPVYFISSRPEAYQVWGEISHGEAEVLASLIAEQAGKRFPDIEFRVDEERHTQDQRIGVQHVAAYIEGHWKSWAAAMVDE